MEVVIDDKKGKRNINILDDVGYNDDRFGELRVIWYDSWWDYVVWRGSDNVCDDR